MTKRLVSFLGLFLFLLPPAFLPGQGDPSLPVGVIAGSVVDEEFGGPVVAAMVRIPDSVFLAITDIKGNFAIPDVPPGKFVVTISHERFKTVRVEDVEVIPGQVASLDIGMRTEESTIEELDAFVVVFDDVQTGEMRMLGDRQKAVTLSDAIGEEAFSRLGLGDAAEAMSKVTGASVVDGKYVLIRGLGDRYSNTLLNGAVVPSADPDRRAVQMDQFPSDLLESIVTSKSFTPDQPGNFSGGSVNMKTKNFPDQFFFKFGAGIKYNTLASWQDVMEIPGGGTDWLAMDDGTRELPELPAVIPTRNGAIFAAQGGNLAPAQTLDAVSKSFHNEPYYPTEALGLPGLGWNLAMGDQLFFKADSSLGYVVSLTYDSGVSHYNDGGSYRYTQGVSDPTKPEFVSAQSFFSLNLDDYSYKQNYLNNPNVPGGEPDFGVTQTTWFYNWGFFGQVAYKPNSYHEMVVRLFHNQNADDRIRHGAGESTFSEQGRLAESYDFLYTERAISSLQFEGKSLFENLANMELSWRASYGKSTQDQPDFRLISFFWDFDAQQYAAAAGTGNDRYFRDLSDESTEFALDLKFPLKLKNRPDSFLKVGAFWQDGNREYGERIFRWSNPISSYNALLEFPLPVGIRSTTANSVVFDNTIGEVSNSLASYLAEINVRSAYGMIDFSLTEKMRIVAGLRAEQTEALTEPSVPSPIFNTANIEQTDLLPAVSLVYALRPSMNLRFAYGKTLARPQYRELADIRIEDPFNREFYAGNSGLELSKIDNFDLRYEWFPRAGETVAASLFYKNMQNPIEVLYNPSFGSISPQNVEEGKIYGIEFEFRQGLEYYWDWAKFWSLGANLSLIESAVTIPAQELVFIRQVFPDAEDTREFIEQSPYLFNADLTYYNYDKEFSGTLALNIIGDRLSLINFGSLPDVYDRSAPQLDLLFSKKFNRNWQVKFSIKNLLGSDFEKSIENNGLTYPYEIYERPRMLSLGFSYEFKK